MKGCECSTQVAGAWSMDVSGCSCESMSDFTFLSFLAVLLFGAVQTALGAPHGKSHDRRVT